MDRSDRDDSRKRFTPGIGDQIERCRGMAMPLTFNVPRILFGRDTLAKLPEEIALLGGSVDTAADGLTCDDLQDSVQQQGVGHCGRWQCGRGRGRSRGRRSRRGHHAYTRKHTDKAIDVLESLSADLIISIGGGGTISLGKAISICTGLPHLCTPTSYSGSEMTPILGETADGRKTTRSDPRILPRTAIYDVDFWREGETTARHMWYEHAPGVMVCIVSGGASPSAGNRLAAWVSALRYDDLPRPVVEMIEDFFLDWYACAVGGLGHPVVVAMSTFARDIGPAGKGTSEVLHDPAHKTSSAFAALVNGAASHVIELVLGTPDEGARTRNLGAPASYAMLHSSYKWHVSCHHTHGLADGLLQIMQGHGLTADAIQSVHASRI